jgi:5-(carboxyamino)imidazole ribonucleotide mutase
MPKGVPVATVAIDGARNAGLLAARILATTDPALQSRIEAMQAEISATVRAGDERLRGQSS